MLSSVLIIDDDTKMRELLASILENEGYSTETAGSAKEAIKACQKFHFDVALIDVELPDMNGTKLLSALREIKPKMAKIIITGHPSIENAVKAVNEKADAYLLKPFNPADLLETIERILAEKKNEYFAILDEIEHAKENAPASRFQRPDKW
jgi:two-component system response regulator HydG